MPAGSVSFVYVVRLAMSSPEEAARMLEWLEGGHCREVCEGGASDAEVILLEGGEGQTLEVRYGFEDRAAFERYERDHAPRLRAEGVERFAGKMEASRWTGVVKHREPPPEEPAAG
jgi:hypothetical protein